MKTITPETTPTKETCLKIFKTLRIKGRKPYEAFWDAGVPICDNAYYSQSLRYKSIEKLAEIAEVSVTALVTGTDMDCEDEPKLVNAVTAAISHAGRDIRDFIRLSGYFSKAAMINALKTGNILLKNLLRMADELGVTLAYLITDGNCFDARDEKAPKTDDSDLRRMGWKTPKHFRFEIPRDTHFNGLPF